MKGARVWLAAALVALAAPNVARAQQFASPRFNLIAVKPNEPPPPGGARFERLQVGSYVAIWDFSPRETFGPLGVSSLGRSAKAEQDAGASPLITADYYITRNVSVGAWWNPQTLDFNVSGIRRSIVSSGQAKVATADVNFWDFHATYLIPPKFLGFLPGSWAEGWSLQGGYTGMNYNVHTNSGFVIVLPGGGVTNNFGFSLYSPNAWLTKSQELGAFKLGGSRLAVNGFASLGYYTSTDFDNDLNVIGGVSIGSIRGLSLNGSVWFNGLDLDRNTRITVGISKTY